MLGDKLLVYLRGLLDKGGAVLSGCFLVVEGFLRAAGEGHGAAFMMSFIV